VSSDSGPSDRQQTEFAIMMTVRRLITSAILFNHKVAEQVGLGSSDSQFISLLQFHGPLTPGQLATLSGLRTGTVTGVIDRLEQAGYTRRDRAPDDRRKVIVSLNDDVVNEKMASHYAGQADALVATLGRYDDQQLAMLAEMLGALISNDPA